jgi:hypothetical protein
MEKKISEELKDFILNLAGFESVPKYDIISIAYGRY